MSEGIEVVRDVVSKEYQHGDLAVRFSVPSEQVDLFWRLFPDIDLPGFVATEGGCFPVTRAGVMGELDDGTLKVRIIIGADSKTTFRKLLPRPKTPAFLFRESPETSKDRMVHEAHSIYGKEARILRTHVDFMLNMAVWKQVGSEDSYKKWLYQQKCSACRWVPFQSMDDWIHCEAAHVRRAGEAGTGYKTPYKMIPLCPNQHDREGCHHKQHNNGESAIGGKEQVDRWFVQHISQWVWDTLKEELGYEHWSQIPPATLRAWAAANGVQRHLPECYRE